MKSIPDAPQIFYEGDIIVLKSLITRQHKQVAHVQTYPLQQKHRIKVRCHFPQHPEWNFSSPLQASLSNEPAIFPTAGRILAVSDIEGNFEPFRDLLLAHGVIDANYNWTFGNGHLVMNGDCFDRGPLVMECLWLLYALEEKAKQQGGYVHFILGNHEIMNMTGDLRYVHNKYLEQAGILQQDYSSWFQPATELGRWLATKNIAEKIGPFLFVHGGIASVINLLPYTLPAINRLCRPWYFTPVEAFSAQFAALYYLLYSSASPFWYRGYAMGYASAGDVDDTLRKFGVRRIIIGHTTVETVTTFFEGRVIDIDTPHAEGISEGVLMEGKQVFRVNKQGLRERIV